MPKINWGDTDDAEEIEEFVEKSLKSRKSNKKDKRFTKNKANDFISPIANWKDELNKEAFVGRVVEVHKRYSFISRQDKDGKVHTRDVWLATVSRKHLTSKKGERNFVAVGDIVLCEPADEAQAGVQTDIPQCVIHQLAPRKSKIARIDPHRSDILHVIASNIDQILIVSSYTKPSVKWGLIDRYLLLAHCEQIKPVIVLNKKDLLDELSPDLKEDHEHKRDYLRKIGYKVIESEAATDSTEQPGYTELLSLLENSTSLFSGHSGVGKSSLVNLFGPEIEQDVEENSDIFYKGRHTTSYASFLRLSTVEGYIVDTPGIRSFCIPEPDIALLNEAFPDIGVFAKVCEFRTCRHIDEPDCGVKKAIVSGDLPEYRLRSFHGILLGSSGREGRLRDLEIE
ncbi:ribosome small subunit-dependent GTPase A [Oligoflexaceae bacterium]|nr:ribosome small subunit-dependent GTPase A [Oligoflexaceae bacterium]